MKAIFILITTLIFSKVSSNDNTIENLGDCVRELRVVYNINVRPTRVNVNISLDASNIYWDCTEILFKLDGCSKSKIKTVLSGYLPNTKMIINSVFTT